MVVYFKILSFNGCNTLKYLCLMIVYQIKVLSSTSWKINEIKLDNWNDELDEISWYP